MTWVQIPTLPLKFYMTELTRLANKYKTDKGTVAGPGQHGFTEVYHQFLKYKRNEVSKLFEIGVAHGSSLRMWKNYFPNAKIYGIDINPDYIFQEERIITCVADSNNEEQLESFINKYGNNFDIIIDDGGHHPINQQKTLGILFKYVKPGGFYILEDLHTSFMKGWMNPYSFPITYDFSSYNTLKRFSDRGILSTPHMEEEDIKYIQENIKKISIFDIKNDKNHITAILEKK